MEYLEITYKQDVGYRISKELYTATQDLKLGVTVFRKHFNLNRMSEEREYCRQGKLKITFDDAKRIILMTFDGSKKDADALYKTDGLIAKVKMKSVALLTTFKRWSD